MISREKIEELKRTGNWMVRFSDNGTGYNDFKWNSVGEWTEAPDWNTEPVCKGGLFGQSPAGWGYCKQGKRFEFCEFDGEKIAIEGGKTKVRRARIICVDREAWELLALFEFGGSLDLRGYNHPLPEGITNVGDSLYLLGYNHPLPEGITNVGGSLYLRGYNHPLPEGITNVGGSLDLEGYNHPLPNSLTNVGGSLYLEGYNHPLPNSLANIGGYLDLEGYNHPLPQRLTKGKAS